MWIIESQSHKFSISLFKKQDKNELIYYFDFIGLLLSLYFGKITCFVIIPKMGQPQALASEQSQMSEESKPDLEQYFKCLLLDWHQTWTFPWTLKKFTFKMGCEPKYCSSSSGGQPNSKEK